MSPKAAMQAPSADRLVGAVAGPGDESDPALRPQSFDEFVGQDAVLANLRVFVAAARGRGEAMDHVLLSGPPGLGKTTLSQILARELGVGLKVTSGPVLARPGDLAAILTNLEPRDVLFVDEVHRLTATVEELLYPALEDRQLDLMIGEGPAARSLRIDLPPFTLIGATTRLGLLSTPLRDRFAIAARLDYYRPEELTRVVTHAAGRLKVALTPDGAAEIARRARGTPRIAGRLLRRVRDFASVAKTWPIGAEIADRALDRLEVDRRGLDAFDRRYLGLIAEHYSGGPVGVETLSAALSEARDTLEEVVEPYLLQQGLLMRTPRGRLLTLAAYDLLGLPRPERTIAPELLEPNLFAGDGPA